MFVEKYIDSEQGPIISLNNPNNTNLKIHYMFGNLYWTIENYNNNNQFCITKYDELYDAMKNLFREIKNSDTFYNVSRFRNGSKFEWISDGASLPEVKNRLVIYEMPDKYLITFKKSKCDLLGKNNDCSVCFSLEDDSTNDMIAGAFDNMFMDVMYQQKATKKRTLVAAR